MKLRYLGTAAAEGVPAVFCPCPACTHARKVGGKEVRTRSGAIVDDALKLDFPGDAYMQALKWGLDYSKLQHVLITHTHRDHFCPEEFENRFKPFSQLPEDAAPLTVYGSAQAREKLAAYLKDGVLEFAALKPYDTVDAGGYRVTALNAVHAFNETALFYRIEKDGKRLLYAHDTDEFTPEHLEFLKGARLDIVSLDCTNGVLECDYIGHMGISDNLRMREKLYEIGAADEKTIFVANHFSHNGVAPYDEMCRRLPGFIVSYDGLTVEA